MTLNALDNESKTLVQNFFKEFPKLKQITLSTHNHENIGELKTIACELFTQYKLNADEGNEKSNKILSRIHIAQPQKRDNRVRSTVNPNDLVTLSTSKVTAKDMQEEIGGAGVF